MEFPLLEELEIAFGNTRGKVRGEGISWQDKVDVRTINSETRRIPEAVKDKYGFNEVFQRFGISRACPSAEGYF